MNSKVYALLVLGVWSVMFYGAEGCGRGSISIQNNGYGNILLSIGDAVPENQGLISKIQTVFTDASRFLYSATRNRSYFENITILLPPTWKYQHDYKSVTWETLDKSDIVVDETSKSGISLRPFTLKTTPCGEPGVFMHLSPTYLLNNDVAKTYGPYEKVIVHEWAHLRFGVFDEYPNENEGEKHFYSSGPGDIEGTRCSRGLWGTMYNGTTGRPGCVIENGLPLPDCRYRDEENVDNVHKYGSIMYKPHLQHVSQFCDDDDDTPFNLHNSDAPTEQNEKCDGKSVWQVLREHPDFKNGKNPSRNTPSPKPKFKLVHPGNFGKRIVLVLDVSGSMTGDRLEKLRQVTRNYITYIVRDTQQLGMVEFDDSARKLHDIVKINSTSRTQLLNKIPDRTLGGTSIGAGILKALGMLQNDGGEMIVITDGMENSSPYIDDARQNVSSAGTTIHSIAVSQSGDKKLDKLAKETGGLSFLYNLRADSNAMNEALLEIGNRDISVPQEKVPLLSAAKLVNSYETVNGSFNLDKSLAVNPVFVIDYQYQNSNLQVVLTSPSGKTYNTSSNKCRDDREFKVYQCDLPHEVGKWSFKVKNSQQQRLALTVISQASDGKVPNVTVEYPITTSVYWGYRTVALNPNGHNQKQALYASVSKGYAPVLHAEVEAIVEDPQAQKTFKLRLLDNGAGADSRLNDGIYSKYFMDFNSDGRYNVKISVKNSDKSVISRRRIIGRGAPIDGTAVTAEPDEPSGGFERIASGGSFELKNYSSGHTYYPPAQISDLKMVSADRHKKTVELQWTATGEQLDVGTANLYELRYATNTNSTYMRQTFSQQKQVIQDIVLSGGNLTRPKIAGEKERYVIQVNETGNVTYVFAVIAKSQNHASPVSNIVSASMRYFPPPPSPDPQNNNVAIIVGVVCGVVGVSLIAVAVIIAIKIKNKSKVSVKAQPPC